MVDRRGGVFRGGDTSGSGGITATSATSWVETFTATAGQTVFNLVNHEYTPLLNAVDVYVNGLRYAVDADYTETDTNTITVLVPLDLGDEVLIHGRNFINQTIVSGTSASATSVFPTGSVSANNVQSAISELDAEKVSKAGDTMTGNLTVNARLRVTHEGVGNAFVVEDSSHPDSSPFIVNDVGQVIVGTTAARANFNNGTDSPQLQIEGTSFNTAAVSIVRNSADNNAPIFTLGKSRGATVGSNVLVVLGDVLGRLAFQGNDGTEFVDAAFIQAEVDGTPGANDMPGRLLFFTTPDGATAAVERMRIDSLGRVAIGGQLLVGTQIDGGAIGNAVPITAGLFRTVTGSQSMASGVTTLVATLPDVGVGMWLLSFNVPAGDTPNYSGFAVIGQQNNSTRFTFSNNGALLTASLGGRNINMTQASGVTTTVVWSLTRIM